MQIRMSAPARRAARVPMLAPLLAALALIGCDGGGDGGSGGEPPGDDTDPGLVSDTDPGSGELGVGTPLASPTAMPPDEGASTLPGATLRLETGRLCPDVDETFELSVTAVSPPGTDGTAPRESDVTASVSLTQSLGDSLELVSQGDGALALRMRERDIVALRADLASDGTRADTTVTVYVGGFAPDAPASILMKKPVAGGCLYALRLGEVGFCGTALSRGGSVALGSSGVTVALEGCTHSAPEELPLVEIAPEPSTPP